ncbi:NIPSNAP family protein [Leeia sp. TBRC 13508]|uniref:NIPSNAP family protein n=1 Tax=Leeia speluncae TaxID=2884804 RepID=A0ABS8D4X9_9NEIS|nr:NIPSNAP family protein [Leeia speluncae]MCB6183026.1 NIPSNAP family protein [Leeia speluncae]
MFYEMRTYRLKTGTLPQYLQLVGEEGIRLQKQYLGNLVGYFYSEIGPLNQIVHIWAYESLDDRERRRNALAADPAWIAFAPKIQALLEEMESKIMKPTAFSPLS